MTLWSYLYASRCVIDPADVDVAVPQLVARSERRNRECGITGALIHTGNRFAQVIEGPDVQVELLIRDLRADPRHTEMVTLQHLPIERRRFRNWSLAYRGPSSFVQRSVALPLAQAQRGSRPAVDKLLALIEEFTLQA